MPRANIADGLLAIQLFGCTEIAEFNFACIHIYQHVLRLDVPMHHLPHVQEDKGPQQLVHV